MKNIFILAKNTISLLMREVINKGALLVMVFFIGRILGKAQLGQYTLALAISQILFLSTDLGLDRLLVREVAKDKSQASKYLFNFGITNFVLSIGTLILVGLVSWILNCPKELIFIIYLCAFSYFIMRFITLFESVFQAFEKMEYQFFSSLFKNIIFIPFGIWHLYIKGDLIGLFYIFLITNALTLILISFLCLRIVVFMPLALNMPFLKEYIKKTLPIWLTQLFAITYLKIATLFLYRMKGEEAVGIYNAAYVLVDGFLVLSSVIATALFPLFSRLYASSVDSLKAVYEKSFNLMVFLFLPMTVSITLLADRLVLSIYGQGFGDAVFVMRFLSCVAFLVIFGGLNSYVIITLDKQKILPFICGFGVLINLVLNFSLIPPFSFIGAAASSVITELVMFSVLMSMIKKYFYDIPITTIFSKTIIAVIVTGGFIYLFRSINMAILLSAAVVLYLSVVYLLKGFIFQEKEYIKKILRIS